MHIVLGKKYDKPISEVVELTYHKQRCEICNRIIKKSTWANKIASHKLEDKNTRLLCGDCAKRQGSIERNQRCIKYTYTTKIIRRGDFQKTYHEVSDETIKEDINTKYQNKFTCECGRMTMIWHKTLPNNMKVTIKGSTKIFDFTDWRCKKCSSSENAKTMNEAYDNKSEEEKALIHAKISKTVKEQSKNFDIKYNMVNGLIKSLKSRKIKKELLIELESCTTVKQLITLNKKVHRQQMTEIWEDEESREKRLQKIQSEEVRKQISDTIRNKWKTPDYLLKQIYALIKREKNLTKEQVLEVLQHKKNVDNEVIAWCNLLKEWYFINTDKFKTTYLYYAKVSEDKDIYKIGITNNLDRRQSFFGGDSGCYDYKIIREFDNRYDCAYVEYKIRVKYCISKTEFIEKKDLKEVKEYIKSINTTSNRAYNEMIKLGYIE